MIMMEKLKEKALDTLKKNDRGEFSVPTHGLYPVQFNWDSAFAALGYCLLNPSRAWKELELLTEAQWEDGMIPHIVFRGQHDGYFPGPDVWSTPYSPATSGITQPPVLATVVRYLIEHDRTLETNRITTVIQRIFDWHCWFMKNRLDPDTQAIRIVHPWESGRDNLVDWDRAMQRVPLAMLGNYQRRDLEHVDADQRPKKEEYDRYLSIVKHGVDLQWNQEKMGQTSPFLMVDPGMTAILLRANRDLNHLLQTYGMLEASETILGFVNTLEKGWNNLWNSKMQAVTAYDPIEQKLCDGISSASLLAPYAGIEDERMLRSTMDHFDRISTKVQFMVPSYDPDHPEFDSDRYWRGPVWLIINSLIGKGFQGIGENKRAEMIRKDSLELVQKSGFAEYFSPMSGTGLGGNDFTWTAAVFLDWIL